jgi:uncharacterized membrane protein YeaQ/YmgE (transglycosylase-associated protein family)
MTSITSHSGANRGATLVRVGGYLGIAGCIIGMGIFVSLCAGQNAAFSFSPIPAIMGAIGLVLALIGGLTHHGAIEDSHILAAIVANLWGLVGGLVLIAVWTNYPIFAK